ncbi:MAG: helix-turn-helix domain-containing protein [Verrucomicrobia bacterium]|nr:helix-turn-helix domain-containing protein [Leptolyngbya sp. ES-bin-22]
MTSRKLSESDKQEILQLYRQPGETASTLATRYGVSNSTISRILKNGFAEADYETLIQQKRGNRTASETVTPLALDTEVPSFETVEAFEPVGFETSNVEALAFEPLAEERLDVEASFAMEVAATEPPAIPVPERSETVPSEEPPPLTANGRRLRKRSSAPLEPIPSVPAMVPDTAPIAPPTVKKKIIDLVAQSPIAAIDHDEILPDDLSEPYADPTYDVAAETTEAMMGEALLQNEADLTDDLEPDDEDDDLEDDDLEDDDLDDDDLDDLDDGALLVGSRIAGKAMVQVLPLAEASLPRTCYLVVDRSAELIARPLREFGDLGQIPEAEIAEKTLPIFDNHRVAKRYSNPRTQRVIKLPDAQVLQKTSSHLQAKGITRLLIDGQVYAL